MNMSERYEYGTVVRVQEHRFQLVKEDGERLDCELAPSVPVGPSDLRRLMDEDAVVRVSLRPSPTTRARIVQRLWRMYGDDEGVRG